MRRSRIGALITATLGLASLTLACATASVRDSRVECSGALSGPPAAEAEYPAFKRQVEASPFYGFLAARLGAPDRCVRDVIAGALRLSYEFRGGGRLEARTDPRIGLSRQRLAVRGLSATEALAMLKDTERDAFGENGCGIAWTSAPAQERSGHGDDVEIVRRGDVCNCQARIVYRKGTLVELVFGTAC